MALWSMTLQQIQQSIANLFKMQTNRRVLSYTEKEAIRFAINEALQRICGEQGVTRWRFLQEDIAATCVSGTNYVDLPAKVLNIITGTVRIEDEEMTLSAVSLEGLLGADIDRDETGAPGAYALDTTPSGSVRLQLYPTPDAAYTIKATCQTLVDEDDLTQFPAWMTGAITDLSTSIAMKRMGWGNPMLYEQAYENAIIQHAGTQGYDGPMHVNRANTFTTPEAWWAGYRNALRGS